MKLKQATQLGIIGMIIQLIVIPINIFSIDIYGLLGDWIYILPQILMLIADALLLTFFIALYKKQK